MNRFLNTVIENFIATGHILEAHVTVDNLLSVTVETQGKITTGISSLPTHYDIKKLTDYCVKLESIIAGQNSDDPLLGSVLLAAVNGLNKNHGLRQERNLSNIAPLNNTVGNPIKSLFIGFSAEEIDCIADESLEAFAIHNVRDAHLLPEEIIHSVDKLNIFLHSKSLLEDNIDELFPMFHHHNVVLIGPGTPIIYELMELGVDYLVETHGSVIARETWRLYDLCRAEMDWHVEAISDLVARREKLKGELSDWYSSPKGIRFPKLGQLESIDEELSRLDSRYKTLWDTRHDRSVRGACVA